MLDGRHLAPPRRVGTCSALSRSAIACRVIFDARIAAMRSISSGRSLTAGRPLPLPLARSSANPVRVRLAIRSRS
jgi:hypothetical protein